jgi:hypothetical protein
MREALIGHRCSRPFLAIAVIRHGSAICALAAVMLVGWTRDGGAETLRWKLNPGETLHYALEAKQVINVKISSGRDKKSTRTNTINLSWAVKSVAPNGDAEITLRFDRVRMKVDQPPFLPLEFDSAPSKIQVPEEFQSADRQIKALAGAEFAFTLRPTGEVADLRIPPQTLKSLRDGAPPEAAAQGMISEQSIKEMLLQSSPPTFPAEVLEPGKTWAVKPSKMPIPGLGALKVDQVFTFQGPDSKAPGMLIVGIEARVSFEPAENVAAKLRTQEGKGSLTFDSENGRVVSSRNDQKMELSISDRGQEIIQATETTSSMTLERR